MSTTTPPHTEETTTVLSPVEESIAAKPVEKFATLVGYTPAPADTVEPTEELLLSPEDLELPDDISTKRPLWENPWAKMGLVSALTALAALIAWGSFHTFNTASHRATQPIVPEEEEPEVAVETEQDGEVGRLKTVAALGSQAQEIQATTDPTNQADPTATMPHSPAPTTGASTSTTTQPQPTTTTTYRPSSPAPAPPPPAARSAPASAAPSGVGSAGSIAQKDPDEVWTTSRSLGSYGVIPVTSNTSASVSSPPSPTVPDTVMPEFSPRVAQQNSQVFADEQAILTGTPRQMFDVAAGQTLQGEMVTPVLWAPDVPEDQQPRQFAMRLNHPLLGTNGAEVLPAGTDIILIRQSMTDSGFTQMQVVGAIPPGGDQNDFIPLPGEQMVVMNGNGEPLVAQEISNVSGQVARLDRNLATIGAISALGEFITRSDETTTTNLFTSTTTSDRPGLNPATIAGSMARGAFEPLQEQWVDRNESRIDELLSRSRVWFIEPGTEVSIFVLDTFSLLR